jgi:hypothetical protein
MLRMTLLGTALALLLIAASAGQAQALCLCYGSLHGTKWSDLNGNGQQDPNEPGLPDWEIALTDSAGGVATTTTDANGDYWFTDVPDGSWDVAEVLQPGWVQTFPTGDGQHHVTLQIGEVIEGLDFGNMEVPEPSGLQLAGLGVVGLARKRRA